MPLLLLGVGMWSLERWGAVERARKADCIIVLGASVWAGGVPSHSLRERTEKAVALYKQGYAPKLLFTGGLGKYGPEEARVGAQLAQRRGVPERDIALELSSHSTWENARNARAICRERGWTRLIVVSDAFHLWRAVRNFRHLGLEAHPSPSPGLWLQERPLTRLFYDAREVVCVLRDLIIGPR